MKKWWLENQEHYVMWILLIGAIFETIYRVNDSYITQNLISSEDKLLISSTYLVIGGVMGLVINLTLSRTVLGQVIDPAFGKIAIPSTKVLLYAMVCGFLSAFSTLLLLWGSSLYDPGIVGVLAGTTVLFVMLWELFKGRIRLSDYIFPALLVFIGVFASTATTGLKFSLISILLLLIGKNAVAAASSLISKEAVAKDNATNFTFWRFLFLTLSGVVIATIIASIRGNIDDLGHLITASFGTMFPYVVFTMCLVYFSNGFQAVSTKHKSVTMISIIGSLPIGLSFLLSLLVNELWSGSFKDLPSDSLLIMIRILGILIIIAGISSLNFRQKKLKESELELAKKT